MPFDLQKALLGRSYATGSVKVYFDESIAQRIGALRKRITDETLSVEGMQSIQDELAEAVADAEKVAYTVNATGRARQVYRDADKAARKDHPITRNFAGAVEADDDYDEAFNTLLWLAQITSIQSPDGDSIDTPALKDIQDLRAMAPNWSLNQIEEKLQELRNAGADFDYVSQSLDF